MKRQKFNKTKDPVTTSPSRKRLSPQQLDRPLKMQDGRLDRVVPLFKDILTKLLGSAGMMRYRKDFLDDLSEAMSLSTKDDQKVKKDK